MFSFVTEFMVVIYAYVLTTYWYTNMKGPRSWISTTYLRNAARGSFEHMNQNQCCRELTRLKRSVTEHF